MKLIKKFIWNILRILKLGGSLQLVLKSGLKEDGWFRSYNTKKSVDAQGNAVPWITYPCRKFLSTKIKNFMDIFEFGSGNSTIWFAGRSNSVISVENDKTWVNIVETKMPKNAKVIYCEYIPNGEYCKTVTKQNKKFHVVVVDGRDRVNCLLNSIDYLHDDGVMILDNSELERYQTGIQMILNKGFRKIDFHGISPIAAHNTCTTIFYRDNNCFNI